VAIHREGNVENRKTRAKSVMVAKQTEKNENLTETGQYTRMRDTRWRFIEKETLKIERHEQKGN